MKKTSGSTGRTLTGFGLIIGLGATALLFSLAGCATSDTARKTIDIDSNPTGARVEVNGEDLGRTPTSYTVRQNAKGNFVGGWGDSPSVAFVAFPPEGSAGLYKQTKSFSPSGFMEAGDRVPAKIFFDLHQELGH
jgi:hypothetical protein